MTKDERPTWDEAIKDNAWIGTVVDVLHLAEYAFVAYHPRKVAGSSMLKEVDKTKIEYAIYIGGKNTGLSADTLDMAILAALAYKYEGLETTAARYMAKILGIEEEPGIEEEKE